MIKPLHGIFYCIREYLERAPILFDTTKATQKEWLYHYFYIARDSVGMVGFCARRAQRALFQTHSALTDAVFYTEFFNEHKSYYSVIAALANSPNRSMRSEFCLLNSRCSKSFFLIERSVVFNTSSIATLRSCAEPMPLRFCKKL